MPLIQLVSQAFRPYLSSSPLMGKLPKGIIPLDSREGEEGTDTLWKNGSARTSGVSLIKAAPTVNLLSLTALTFDGKTFVFIFGIHFRSCPSDPFL